jgi:hypothetical protein
MEAGISFFDPESQQFYLSRGRLQGPKKKFALKRPAIPEEKPIDSLPFLPRRLLIGLLKIT